MYLNKLNDPLSCLFTFPKMCCSVQFWRSFQEQNNQTCEKISAFADITIILFCWRRKYTEFFRNYSKLKAKVEIMRKRTAALEGRWLARGSTALQVVRTSFLGPRPRRLPPPPPPGVLEENIFIKFWCISDNRNWCFACFDISLRYQHNENPTFSMAPSKLSILYINGER